VLDDFMFLKFRVLDDFIFLEIWVLERFEIFWRSGVRWFYISRDLGVRAFLYLLEIRVLDGFIF
jgi:hypothetical protein